jgi:ADP-ribosylglycohydrolase
MTKHFTRSRLAPTADIPANLIVSLPSCVLTAFRSALWQLLHATNLEEAVVDTVMRGGDTDTKKNRSDP